MAAKARLKPIVFISHIAEERSIALALQELLQKSFVGLIEVFVSSSPNSIGPGREWLRKIRGALEDCVVVIVLVSKESVRRPWINFEAGAGWIRDISVIPICHSGMTVEQLPMPLKALQAINAREEELRLIFPEISQAISSAVPDVDFTHCLAVIREYEEESEMAENVSSVEQGNELENLKEHEYRTLQCIAAGAEAPDATTPIWAVRKLAKEKGISDFAVTLALKILERKELIEMRCMPGDFDDSFWVARILDEGWLWLNRHVRPDVLRCSPPKRRNLDDSPNDEVPF